MDVVARDMVGGGGFMKSLVAALRLAMVGWSAFNSGEVLGW